MNTIYTRLFVIGFASLFFSNIQAQTSGDYRSRNSFNWTSILAWQTFNGTSWVNTNIPPNNTNGVVTIRNGHTITLSAARTIDQVIIESGGELVISDLLSNFTITLADGVGTDIQNNGTLRVGLNETLSGPGNIINGGTLVVGSGGVLGATTLNNGTMEVDNATFNSTSVTNQGTLTVAGLLTTLNLNNTTLTNNGLVNFTGVGNNIDGSGGGVFINTTNGTIFNSNILNVVRINPAGNTVAFTNAGLIKGYAEVIIRNPTSNTGTIAPGNNDTPSLTINPALVTGKTPTFSFEVTSALAFDQINFNNTDASGVDISGATLTVTDNSTSTVTTPFTIFTSSVPITGTFASVNIPPTLGSIVYNTYSIVIQKIAREYTWTGATSSVWTTSTNWSPTRSSPATSDILVFNGGSPVVTGITTQTVNGITLRNNATVSLQPINATQQLSVGTNTTSQLSVEPGSSLTVRHNGAALLNININNGARASIGGTVHMEYGTFNINDNLLQLYASASPLARTNGQFAIGSAASIEFGTAAQPGGSALTLANNIFNANPSVASITMQRTNGVVFGNQTITVNELVLHSGNITTNATGRIRFSTTASNPAETLTSKIIGYAEMMPRSVNMGAVNFLGLQLAAGSDIGTASITRVTGPAGINTFNGLSSIAATWFTTTSVTPVSGRVLSFSWFSDFDNVVNPVLSFQNYHFDLGPAWDNIGPLSMLASTGNPRTTTPVLALKLGGSWTLSDQNNILPITLSHMGAAQVQNSIELDWKTSSEENSDYFEVQRLENDGETFKSLGTVRAKGFSKKVISYHFTDNTPLAGENYYRLKLIDLDGSYEFSKVVKGTYKPEPALTLYPNPGNGDRLTFIFPENINATLSIYDIHQKQYLVVPVKGINHTVEFGAQPLPKGIYLVRYTNGQISLSKKLVIQ